MSLLGLALIGRNNEPLYLCDCVRIIKEKEFELSEALAVNQSPSSSGEEGQPAETTGRRNADENEASKQNPLGLLDITTKGSLRSSLGIEHRLMIHSALDQLNESINATRTATGGWLGLLSQLDEAFSIYGYVTATNIKILLLTETNAKDAYIRSLMTELHEYYVRVSRIISTTVIVKHCFQPNCKNNLTDASPFSKYCLNPFCDIKADINSRQFDSNVTQAVKSYDTKRRFD